MTTTAMSFLLEPAYFTFYLGHIVFRWSYRLSISFRYRFLRRFFSPSIRALLDHEHKLIVHDPAALSLLPHLWVPFSLIIHRFFPSSDHDNTEAYFSRLQTDLTDTPIASFLRIIHTVHILPTFMDLNTTLGGEIQYFWYRGITGVSKPDHFLYGGKWSIEDLPDPREQLGNDPLLCAIAASTAEQMAEAFNWGIELGLRRDLKMLRARKPYWDKNLVPFPKESAPAWCKDVGPAPVQTVVDRRGGDDVEREMLESKIIDLSPSFRKRNLLAHSQFMYVA